MTNDVRSFSSGKARGWRVKRPLPPLVDADVELALGKTRVLVFIKGGSGF
jgi:hypothetical protein